MKRKRGLVHVILALLMSMLLIVSTGCGKSGSGDSSSDKKMDKTETLADVNTIPEDGVITKEQFKTVAGENKKVQFKGTTDDGITYIWTYDCSKIQNPADQNLKIAIPYAGRSYAKEYSLPSHSLFTALYTTGRSVVFPPNSAASPSSTRRYCFLFGTPTR